MRNTAPNPAADEDLVSIEVPRVLSSAFSEIADHFLHELPEAQRKRRAILSPEEYSKRVQERETEHNRADSIISDEVVKKPPRGIALSTGSYRPWHRKDCPARTLWNIHDGDCICPAEQFTHGFPVWEPGDEPRESRAAIISTSLSRALTQFQRARNLTDDEMLTALTECVRWWVARILTVQQVHDSDQSADFAGIAEKVPQA